MSKAVRYDEFGRVEVLRVEEVERPVPGDGQVLVRVKAAGINISEAVIRAGAVAVAGLFPSTFPSGQGSDLAGVVEEAGAGVGGCSPGDEVIGFSNNRVGAAGGVGSLAAQLARRSGATVIGLASQGNHQWLNSHGAIPVEVYTELERRHTHGKIVLRP